MDNEDLISTVFIITDGRQEHRVERENGVSHGICVLPDPKDTELGIELPFEGAKMDYTWENHLLAAAKKRGKRSRSRRKDQNSLELEKLRREEQNVPFTSQQ